MVTSASQLCSQLMYHWQYFRTLRLQEKYKMFIDQWYFCIYHFATANTILWNITCIGIITCNIHLSRISLNATVSSGEVLMAP